MTLALIDQLLTENRLDEAENLLRTVLQTSPESVWALRTLGRISLHRNRADEACRLFFRAAELSPDAAEVQFELGVACLVAERWAEAAQAFERHLLREPGHADTLFNLGWAMRRLNDDRAAATRFAEAAAAAPGNAAAWFNLGNTRLDLGETEEAVTAFEAAPRLTPSNVDAWNNLGIALRRLGRTAEAADMFRRAFALAPTFAKAASNLGNALTALGRHREAIDAYRAALQQAPDDREIVGNLALCLGEQCREAEAMALLRPALAMVPDDANLWRVLGIQQLALNRTDEAAASFRRAIACDPKDVEAWNNLAKALSMAGHGTEATEAFRHALDLAPDNASLHSNLIFHLVHLPNTPPEDVAREARRYGERQERVPALPARPRPAPGEAGRRLRIGYVSPDFREHAVAMFFEPYLEHRAPEDCETFCYSLHARPDAVTERLRRLADHWRDIADLPADSAARLIREDGIDILIDLAGHTAGNRLAIFALKPAPIQATWFGYPGTTGLTRIDYRITDPITHPAGTEKLFSETLFRSRVGVCFRPPSDRPVVPPPPSLANGRIRFGSFNKFQKVNGETLRAWARILAAIPDSRLVIIVPGASAPGIAEATRARVAAEGIAPERLEIHGMLAIRDFLALVASVDVALDPWPYSGGTTSELTLLMGVPLVAMEVPGLSNCTPALLHSQGLARYPRTRRSAAAIRLPVATRRIFPYPEPRARGHEYPWRRGLNPVLRLGGLAARDVDDYVRIATTAAADLEWRAAFRRRMPAKIERMRRETEIRTVRRQEAIYRLWWQSHVAGIELDCSERYDVLGGPLSPDEERMLAERGRPIPAEALEKPRLFPASAFNTNGWGGLKP